MPLTLDSIVHQNSGGTAAATSGAAVSVALAAPGGVQDTTSAGNTVFVFLTGGNGQTFSTTPPAGWAYIQGTINGASDVSLRIYFRGPTQGLAAGESSWNFTPSSATAGPVDWTVLEVEGVASGGNTDTFVIDTAQTGGTPVIQTSGTTAAHVTGLTSTFDGLAFSVHTSYNPSGTDTWGSHTGGFAEIVERSQSNGGTGNVTMSVSALHVDQVGTYGATATCSRSLTGTNAGIAYTFVINAAGARKAADLRFIDGGEHGLITGNTTTGLANNKLAESVTAGVSISTTAARSGNYGWLYSSTSAACNSVHYNATQMLAFSTTGTVQGAARLHFRLPTLPGADAELWVLRDIGTSALITVRFIDSSDKIGLKVGSGTEQVSDSAVTANQWFGVDIGFDMSTTTHKVDWSVDYNAELTDTTAGVAQTQATATGTAGPTIASIRRGWTTAITATMHFDDFAASGDRSHYPIGDLRVLPAKVDPAGTVAVSGSTANFGVMTANGTVAAWNATNARNAVDDIPPDLSATRDAAVAVNASATDYIDFPVENINMAALGVNIRGKRAIFCLWAASTTAATMRLSAAENGNVISGAGTSEADPNADNTTAVWVQFMIRPTTGRIDWNQTKSDGLTVRFGSNDATPDIGVDSFVVEVAVVKTQSEVLFGEPGSLYVEASRDPDTAGLVGFTATVPVGDVANLDYEVDGVPTSVGPLTTDNSPYYQAITDGGDSLPKVNKIALNPI